MQGTGYFCRTFAVVNRLVNKLAQYPATSSRNLTTSNSNMDAQPLPSQHVPQIVPIQEALKFMQRCMEKAGASRENAQQLAEVLVMGDYRGHFSHGLNRLDMYIQDVQGGTCSATGTPTIEKETSSTALVDGHNLLGLFSSAGSTRLDDAVFGPVVGKFAMDLAIKKAKESGVGWVAARASNHYGIAGYYGLEACKEGMIGMSFTNTSPLCVPTRAKDLTLGTNPLCFAAPGTNGDAFVLDMATTTVALGKVEIAMRKQETIPPVWGVDQAGKETTDPEKIYHGGGLLPLGGNETTGGYKGYGLNVMVEILCGILANAAFGPTVRLWKDTHVEANLGQGFVAINPACFGDGFQERLQTFMNILRHLEPADPSKPVLVAGDPERIHMIKCDGLGGIPYHVNQIYHAKDLARSLGVEPMKVLKDAAII